MRYALRSALIAITIALGLAWLAHRAPAQEIKFPSNLSIEGRPVCAGPPNAGDPLIYGGAQWCNFVPNDTCETFRDNAGNPECAIRVDNLNQISLGDGVNHIVMRGASQFIVGTGALFWGNGGDVLEEFAPRSTTTLIWFGALTSVSGFGGYTNTKALHVQSVSVAVQTAGATCTTTPHVQLASGATTFAASDINLANGSGGGTVGGLNIAIAGSAGFFGKITTAAAGCGTSPQNMNYVVEFTTD